MESAPMIITVRDRLQPKIRTEPIKTVLIWLNVLLRCNYQPIDTETWTTSTMCALSSCIGTQAQHISDCTDDGDSSDMYTPVLQPASRLTCDSNGQPVQICVWQDALPDANHKNCCPALILRTEVLCPTQHNRVHFWDVLPSQSLGLVLKILSILHPITEYSGKGRCSIYVSSTTHGNSNNNNSSTKTVITTRQWLYCDFPLTGQCVANFRLLANQWAERRLVTQWRHGCRAMSPSVCNADASNGGRSLCVQISRERSYSLPIYWYHSKGNWLRYNFAADSFYIMKLLQ